MSDHAAMKARAEQAFTHYVAPLQILPGPDEPVHLARKLAADVLELLAALDLLVNERDEARDKVLTHTEGLLALTAKRDGANHLYRSIQKLYLETYARAEAAEALVQQLKAALETIWRMHDIPIGGESYSAAMRETARAALADVEEDA